MPTLKIFFLFFILSLTGCSNTISQPPSPNAIPPNTIKEVYIQPGTMRVLGPIKEVFRKKGWKVDEVNKDTQRYFVHLNTKKIQMLCWNENSEIEVELVLMDRETGSSVFSVFAQTCDQYSNLREELSKVLSQLK
ncbi:hypothetical protein JCM30760_11140 [Thiomicrorhabdus hydrogeniphila]